MPVKYSEGTTRPNDRNGDSAEFNLVSTNMQEQEDRPIPPRTLVVRSIVVLGLSLACAAICLAVVRADSNPNFDLLFGVLLFVISFFAVSQYLGTFHARLMSAKFVSTVLSVLGIVLGTCLLALFSGCVVLGVQTFCSSGREDHIQYAGGIGLVFLFGFVATVAWVHLLVMIKENYEWLKGLRAYQCHSPRLRFSTMELVGFTAVVAAVLGMSSATLSLSGYGW